MDVLAALEPRVALAHAMPVRDVPVHHAMMHDVMRTIVERCRRSRAGARKRQAHAHDGDENFLFETHNALLLQSTRPAHPAFRMEYGRHVLNLF